AIGGVAAGSAPVDRTLVTLTDQAGRATLTVTVPKGVKGTVPLTVTTPVGTRFSVPITVFEPVASSTFGWPSTLLTKKGSTVKYTAVVSARGVAPTGVVTILDGSRPIATVTLTAADNGRVTLTLPALSRGLHKLSASYAGSDTVKASASPFWLPVIIW
ncbi:MAG: Ig-like domain-containing protein, partial [Actinobacteria bacterium]|nr:Ig-like domain-containing protein [Actinomycetota bacterium]